MRLRIHAMVRRGEQFRRNGITFTPVPQVVDTAQLGWTDQQIAALKATEQLYVEEVHDFMPPPPSPVLEKARAKG